MSLSTKKKILFPILATCVSSIFAVLLLEVVLRITGVSTAHALHTVDEKTYQKIPGIWSPGQDFVWYDQPALPYNIRINSLGYRGPEISVDKRANEFRIFIAGDSFTFGSFVENDETMPAQIESYLNHECGSKNITVINAGILGSSIRTQTQMIERGLILKPDLVTLVFYNNDIYDLADPLWDRLVENRALKTRFPVSILWPLLRNTAVWNFGVRMQGVLHSMNLDRSTIERDMQVEEEEAENEDLASFDETTLKAAYQESLYKLADTLHEQQIPFVFSLFPGHRDLNGNPKNLYPMWAEQIATAAEIPTINLHNNLLEGLLEDIHAGFLLPEDSHPSALGYSVAGRAMAEFLVQQPEVKSFCMQHMELGKNAQ